jgi:transcriptional regulator with GAF, ATPase, and Fis domain/tetratricopeptide (TPR) repeat protein
LRPVNQVGTRERDGRRRESLAGRYRVLQEFSVGAGSEIFLVEDVRGNGRGVLKLLPAQVSAKRLRGEFARLTEVSHPNIVRLLDAGILNGGRLAGRAFLVTEYLPGKSLAESLPVETSEGRFEQFALAAESLVDALAYLHGQGILHGDLSPANIRCDEFGKPVLIDFGLAELLGPATGASRQAVAGTMGFIAPEALLGERGPSGDLFALGATLYDAWAGAPPFGLGMEAVRRAWEGPPPAPSSLYPGLPIAWDNLMLRLVAAVVEDRPSSAREALREIRRELPGRPVAVEADLAVPFSGGDPFAGVVVGRSEEEACLRRHVEQLSRGAAPVCLLCVVGSPGSGRRTLIRRALREARLGLLAQTLDAFDIEEGECSHLTGKTAREGTEQDLRSPSDLARDAQERLACLARELELRAANRPLCLALSGSLEDEALARVLASNPPNGRLLVVLPCDRASEGEGIAVVRLKPLSRESIAELGRRSAGIEAPGKLLDQIVIASAGLAGAVVLLLRGWIDATRAGRPQNLDLVERSGDLDRLLDAGFASLSGAAREAVLMAALSSETPPTGSLVLVETDGGASEGVREARGTGWLLPGTRCLPGEAHGAALWRALVDDAHLQGIARKAAARLPAGDTRLPEIHLALGERAEAAASFWRAMRAAAARMAWSKAVQFGSRAQEAGAEISTWVDRLTFANALGILGRYDEALAVLDAGDGTIAPEAAAAVLDRKAWIMGRRGDPVAARRLLESALAGLPPDREDALLLRSRLARMLVSSGQYSEAVAAAEPALHAPGEVGLAARESAVLALAYAGKLEAARKLLEPLLSVVRQASDQTTTARVAAIEGLVEQLAGRPVQAANAYRRAVDDYEKTSDLHGAAAATFNLGCTLAEIGDYAGAISALDHAVRELGWLGASTDHALAVFNIGQLFLQLGDVDAASRAIERLRSDARASEVGAFEGYALLLAAELQRRQKALPDSRRNYQSAVRLFDRLGMQAMAAFAGVGLVEALVEQGMLTEARAILGETETRTSRASEPAGGGPSPTGESMALAHARIALADPGTSLVEAAALAQTLMGIADAAKALGRLPMAWRTASLAAQLLARAGDPRKDVEKESARMSFEEVKMKTPAKYLPGLEADGEAKVLALRPDDGKDASALAQRATLLDGRLRRLLRINKRLNSDLRLSRVLETIIDTVIELTDAERGFLLLRDSGGELVVKVARNIDQTTLEGHGSSLSRSIAKQAADTGEPVITVDAAGDSRWSEHLSVSDLHLRSVLAVPLAVKGAVVGTIYVDHRLRKGIFGEDELAMVLDFAEQGAIAIENARIVSELRRREQQVQSLNRRLERELRAQEAALSDARVELEVSRQAAALRYDYRHIVGQSPSMLDLFRLLDRVTDTNLPVVIEGESGTGKELVARAIHFHGPRKDRAFVSENCAAIPETLLESALFGHVRGAFTGAEREARGLFAIADGGTLFLDEVSEMSPAMQGKLLRVLQSGEFHRVGGERCEKVDVRVLVATNRNLAQLVEEGKFRKDLFYRLSVVRLHLPPLRERREDIPLLVRHFLEALAHPTGSAAKNLEPAALAKLCAYAWPGNVRELENEIARAGAFAGATIGASDLSAHVQSGHDPSEAAGSEPDSLRLRQRVERLERQLIREAMTRSQGNQTKASATLGLSRFGLQKKMRRYNLGS